MNVANKISLLLLLVYLLLGCDRKHFVFIAIDAVQFELQMAL